MSKRKLWYAWAVWGVVLVLPLFVIFAVGIPINPHSDPRHSERCYTIGKWDQFITCYRESETRLTGKALLREVWKQMESYLPGLGNSFLVVFGLCLLSAPGLILATRKKGVRNEPD